MNTFERVRAALALLGMIVCIIGSTLVVGFLADRALSQWLRLTGSWKLFVRFVWLDGKIKRQMQADMEYEARARAAPLDSEPESPPDLSVEPHHPEPPPEDDCHPLARAVPLSTTEPPAADLMEAAAAAYDAQRFSGPPGSDEGILDSGKTEAECEELSSPLAQTAREMPGSLRARIAATAAHDEAECIIDQVEWTLLSLLNVYGYMLPSGDARQAISDDLRALIVDLLLSTPKVL